MSPVSLAKSAPFTLQQPSPSDDGAPDPGHAINDDLVFFVGSHPQGGGALGKEVISGQPLTLMGSATFLGLNPDFEDRRALQVPGTTSDGAHLTLPTAVKALGTQYSVFVDIALQSAFSWATLISVMSDALTTWGSPFGIWKLLRQSTGTSMAHHHIPVGSTAFTVYSGASGSFPTAATRQRFGLTRNGSVLKFYLNGVQIGSDVSITSAAPNWSLAGAPDLMVLGNRSSTAPGEGVAGLFLQTRIWGRVLSASEMSNLHQNPTLGCFGGDSPLPPPPPPDPPPGDGSATSWSDPRDSFWSNQGYSTPWQRTPVAGDLGTAFLTYMKGPWANGQPTDWDLYNTSRGTMSLVNAPDGAPSMRAVIFGPTTNGDSLAGVRGTQLSHSSNFNHGVYSCEVWFQAIAHRGTLNNNDDRSGLYFGHGHHWGSSGSITSIPGGSSNPGNAWSARAPLSGPKPHRYLNYLYQNGNTGSGHSGSTNVQPILGQWNLIEQEITTSHVRLYVNGSLIRTDTMDLRAGNSSIKHKGWGFFVKHNGGAPIQETIYFRRFKIRARV